MLFYVDVIKMEISCLSAGKFCEVQDLCASFRACAACRAVQMQILLERYAYSEIVGTFILI